MTQLLIDSMRDVKVIRPGVEHLDASTAKHFRREVLASLAPTAKVVIDLSDVQFVDSSGCGAILAILRHLNADGEGPGELKISVATNPVRALFEMVRLHKIVEIYNSLEAALRAFDSD